MRKTIYILAATGAILTGTMAGAGETKQRFVHDVSTDVYTTSMSKGRQHIDGRHYPSGQRFHLVVRGDRVSGVSDGLPVSLKTGATAGAEGSFASVTQ